MRVLKCTVVPPGRASVERDQSSVLGAGTEAAQPHGDETARFKPKVVSKSGKI
jgi:hypothetical protein